MKIMIKGATVVNPAKGEPVIQDIYIDEGCVAEIGDLLDIKGNDVEVIEAEGKYAVPGLVDMHCHLREPGFTYKETIETGTAAAALGGFTSVACMPNTNPVIDSVAIYEFVKNRPASVNVYPIGAISKQQEGKELSAIGQLRFAGAVAISDDGKPVQSPVLMKRAMQYAASFDMTVISHCEDMDLSDGGCMNEGYVSTILGLKGISKSSEEIMIARDIILAEETGAQLHIAHVSTKGSVELIRAAKERGVNVTAETCPHYFTLTDEACMCYNTLAKVNPPLRNSEDVEAIKQGLADDTIDAIATDHAPHHADDKNTEFQYAASGISGFETAFALGYTYLVMPKVITISKLIKKMTVTPASIIGINKGVIEKGKPADITIINPNASYKVDIKSFASKGKNSPFNGYELTGTIECTIVNGKFVVREGVLE